MKDYHHRHRVARPSVSIAVSTSWRHFGRSCARIHAVLRPRLWGWRSSSIVRSHVRLGRPARRRQFGIGESLIPGSLDTAGITEIPRTEVPQSWNPGLTKRVRRDCNRRLQIRHYIIAYLAYIEWYHVWLPSLTSKRAVRVCRHQLSFLFLFLITPVLYNGPHNLGHKHTHMFR